MIEEFVSQPKLAVTDAEFRRLLGYPRGYVPAARARALARGARAWYALNGQPWGYLREIRLQLTETRLHLDGVMFHSKRLREHLLATGAQRAVLVVVSAGRECEEHAHQLWQEGKPDEYYFCETFGSAAVEYLVAAMSGRICELAENDGLMAVPHYSPGYDGWDVADQNRLFGLAARGRSGPFPGPVEVLASGMLKPKKSLLAVIGLAGRKTASAGAAGRTPCDNCSLTPCRFRRAPFRHARGNPEDRSASGAEAIVAGPDDRGRGYTVNPRALRKWAQERVKIEQQVSGSIEASFRFDGTTCSDQGRPLAFDYQVTLSSRLEGYQILRAECRPAPGDTGHTQMCAYLGNARALRQALDRENPLLGQPLADVLNWSRVATPSGCHCNAESRAHIWGLALEAIHFALTHADAELVASPTTSELS